MAAPTQRGEEWVEPLAAALAQLDRPAGVDPDHWQEAWLVARRRRRSDPGFLGGVVRRLAARERRGEARRRGRERAAARPEAVAPSPSPSERSELRAALEAALARIDPDRARAVHLRFVEERSVAQISRETAVAEDTVRWRLRRGLEELRHELERRHGGWARLALATAAIGFAPRPEARWEWVAFAGTTGKWLGGGALLMLLCVGALWWRGESADPAAPEISAGAPRLVPRAAWEPAELEPPQRSAAPSTVPPREPLPEPVSVRATPEEPLTPGAEVNLELPRLEGAVRAGEVGLAGASVALYRRGAGPFGPAAGDWPRLAEARTDARGRFDLGGWSGAADGDLVLVATHPVHGAAQCTADKSGFPDPLVLEMPSRGGLEIEPWGLEDGPAANEVWVTFPPLEQAWFRNGSDRDSLADALGRLTAGQLRAGHFEDLPRVLFPDVDDGAIRAMGLPAERELAWLHLDLQGAADGRYRYAHSAENRGKKVPPGEFEPRGLREWPWRQPSPAGLLRTAPRADGSPATVELRNVEVAAQFLAPVGHPPWSTTWSATSLRSDLGWLDLPLRAPGAEPEAAVLSATLTARVSVDGGPFRDLEREARPREANSNWVDFGEVASVAGEREWVPVELLVRDSSGAPVFGTLSVEYGSPAASELQQLWVTGGFGGTYSVQLPAGPTQLHLRSGLAPATWPGVRREFVVGYDREALPVQLPVPASLRIAAPGGGGEAGFWVELTPEHAPTRRFATTGPHLSVTALPPGRWDVRRGLAGAAASTFQALEVAPGQILELP